MATHAHPRRAAPRPARLPASLLLAAFAAAPPPARAALRTIRLQPAIARIDFTTYALGLFPLAGHFAQFTGALQIDPAQPDTCTITLDVDVTSLAMADPARTRQALAPDMLNAAAFPHLTYRGTCSGGHASGTLTLHGTSHTLQLATFRRGDDLRASGSLKRQDFGITGMQHLVGRTIGIGFTVAVPP